MSYIKDNFLLENKTAERLYETYAKDMPINFQTRKLNFSLNLIEKCWLK